MIRLALPPFAAVLVVAACAMDPTSSYVGMVEHPGDVAVLSDGMASFVASHIPVASAVALDPTPADQSSNAVTPALATLLRNRGFTVADSAAPAAGVHRVRYLVTQLDGGDLVRVMIDANVGGARFFTRNTAGELQPGGPLTMIQAEAAP